MKTFQPADHLHSRTFLGLLVAQFLAAFNDQAIHAAAMFFAINTKTMSEATAITLMPILFFAPWAIFCTVAGYLADRFSKRFSLILWKVVEVGIALLTLAGFWIGRQPGWESVGAWLVLSTVFLMGMHSAFFVPAKYGAMPEILTPRMLSKGNGVLESLSFLAVILGTVAGGVLSTVFRSQEYMIGLILVVLAVVGAVASFFIERIPAANATRSFPAYIYQPLVENIRRLWAIKPLRFALVGIAFYTFLVAFMRAVVYMHGQAQLPQWDEATTSYIVGMVALGIGIGSPLVGYLSGGKVEVGLVPIGALGMMLATAVAALFLSNIPILVTCIVFMGFFTGFYLVPLFSLLQHRAPKTSKGDAVATSNFVNITGAIASSLVFGLVNLAAVSTGFTPQLPEKGQVFVGPLDKTPEYDHGKVSQVVIAGKTFEANPDGPDFVFLDIARGIAVKDQVALRAYGNESVTYFTIEKATATPVPVYDRHRLPSLLFLGAGALTLFTLGLLWYFLPDLFRRTTLWMRGLMGYKMELAGMLRLPGNGPVVLATNASSPDAMSHLERAADRVLVPLPGGADAGRAIEMGRNLVVSRSVLCVSLSNGVVEDVIREVLTASSAPILPVHHADVVRNGVRHVYVVAGQLLAPNSSVSAIRAELVQVSEELTRRLESGGALEKEAGEH